MGVLGVPYRVMYESKGLQRGLTNIVGFVTKPDLTIAGPYLFTEFPPPAVGRYYFDYYSNNVSPQGEYQILILSPNEGFSHTSRMPLYKQSVGGLDPSCPILVGQVDDEDALIQGPIFDDDLLVGYLIEEDCSS